MAKFDNFRNDKFKCDNCKKEFLGREIKLVEAADNIKILTPPSPFRYIDKNDNITGGGKQPSRKKGDQILSCPHCGQIHLFGMDVT